MASFHWKGWACCAVFLAGGCASADLGAPLQGSVLEPEVPAIAPPLQPIAATCTIDGRFVDCSIAVWDLAIARGVALQGRTARSYCEDECARGAGASLNRQAEANQGADCGHTTVVKDLTCRDCARLADAEVPLRCDADPCTVDWCDGLACFHRAPLWIGAICANAGCQSTLQCDPGTCKSPGCLESGFRVCWGCDQGEN